MANNKLIIRMLGNDFKHLHGYNQTLVNLQFTIENELPFENTDKIYVLNRIINPKKKKAIIDLLKKNKIKFIDIALDIDKLKQIPKLKSNEKDILNMKWKDIDRLTKEFYQYNLFLIANNECRNFCIEYGIKNKYNWIFVLDSNSFLRQIDFNSIINYVKDDTEYIIIPQRRLSDKKLKNNDIFNKNFIITNLPEQEPQIAFRNTSKIRYNEKIPYGRMPKAELLNALGVPGKWNKFIDYIEGRELPNNKWQKLSNIIRLDSCYINNNSDINWKNRFIGLYYLIEEAQIY